MKRAEVKPRTDRETIMYDANISPATVITALHDLRFAGKTALKGVARLMHLHKCASSTGEAAYA